MIKTIAASNAAKSLALCVCPVIGVTAALKVKPVREAIHRATAPEKGKPKRARIVHKAAAAEPKAVCPDPVPVNIAAVPLWSSGYVQPGGLTILPEVKGPQSLAFGYAPGALAGASSLPGGPGGSLVPVQQGAVPEPATWLQMVLGFGAAGAALRVTARRRAPFSPASGPHAS